MVTNAIPDFDADSTPGDPGPRGKTKPRLTSIALSMIPLILLTLTLGIIGLVVLGIPAHQEHWVLKNTGKVNISRCSSPEFPPAWLDDIIEKDRTASQVRQGEGKQNNSFMGRIRVLCNSANGKYPGIDTVLTTPPSMEVQGSTAPPLNKLVEFLAIITLVLSGIALALTLIVVLCWALNSKYLRNYLRGLFTGQWHGNPNNALPTPSMVSIHGGDHEGESEGS